MASVWRIICKKCNAMSKIGYCGGCGIRATKETFVNCAVSESRLPPTRASFEKHSLSPMSEFGRSIFSNGKVDFADRVNLFRSVVHSGFLFKKGGDLVPGNVGFTGSMENSATTRSPRNKWTSHTVLYISRVHLFRL